MRWDEWGRHLQEGDEEGAINHRMLGCRVGGEARGRGGKQAASRIGIDQNAHEEGTPVRGRG